MSRFSFRLTPEAETAVESIRKATGINTQALAIRRACIDWPELTAQVAQLKKELAEKSRLLNAIASAERQRREAQARRDDFLTQAIEDFPHR